MIPAFADSLAAQSVSQYLHTCLLLDKDFKYAGHVLQFSFYLQGMGIVRIREVRYGGDEGCLLFSRTGKLLQIRPKAVNGFLYLKSIAG